MINFYIFLAILLIPASLPASELRCEALAIDGDMLSPVHDLGDWQSFLIQIQTKRGPLPERLTLAYDQLTSFAKDTETLPFDRHHLLAMIAKSAEVDLERLEAILRRAIDIHLTYEVPVLVAYLIAMQNFYHPVFDSEEDLIGTLKKEHKKARTMALLSHATLDQKYGRHPYEYHLRAVRRALKRFGFGPDDSILGLKLGTAGWLHDAIEDTYITLADIYYALGLEMGDAMYGLTNVAKDPKHEDGIEPEDVRQLRKRLTKLKTVESELRRLTKLADRIANTEMSMLSLFLGEDTKIEKYRNEWHDFYGILHVPGEADEMWRHLQLMTFDEDYAVAYLIEQEDLPADFIRQRPVETPPPH